MLFTEFFIRRPAFTIVITLAMTIVGLICYARLPLQWVPNITPPVVSIYTSFPGANPTLVESQITTPIESALTGIEGIETLSSSSKQDASFVTIVFKADRNINIAVEDVRSALQRISSSLPSSASKPEVEKANPLSNPILYIAFSDAHRSEQQVSDYLKQFVTPQLQSVDGVATISTYGEQESSMHVWLDPMKMAAANITVDDISQLLKQENIQVPSGKIRSPSRYFGVVLNQSLKSANDFNELILRDNQNQIVRLKDVANAVVDAKDPDVAFRVNGQPAVALAVIPQSNANPLEVAQSIEKEFQKIKKELPEGMQGKVVFSQATFIQSSIDHVYRSLIEATILVLIVIYLFLASLRAAFIPIVTIPVCIISTFALMHLGHISINTVTLMAFVLAIGLVVDDAIVMLENISRHIESGMHPFAAAIQGSREMVFPIIAMTLTLAAVYAPIAFTSGMLGAVFWEFAATLASAVLISGFVAITLSPMMSARLLKKPNHNNQYTHWLNSIFAKIQLRYQLFLDQVLLKKWRVLLLLGIVGILGIFIFHSLPSEVAPMEDMDEIDVYVSAPRDSSFAYTEGYVRNLEKIYRTIPEIQTIASEIGFWSTAKSNQFIILTPKNKRHRDESSIIHDIEAKVKNISGVDVWVSPGMSPLSWYSDGSGSSITMKVMSPMSYKNLHTVMEQLIAATKKSPVFSSVNSTLKWDGSQFEVNINRDKAADMNVSMQNITNMISVLLAGRQDGYFEYDGNLYDIILQLNRSAQSNPNIISELYVRNENGKMVPISGLVTMTETTSPESLPHFNRMRADTLHAQLSEGYTIGDGVLELQRLSHEYLPDNVKFTFEGEAQTYLDSNYKMAMTFFLALVFIYLILVAQFESFIDPFIILLTVPFALIGAVLMLKLTGSSLNIFSSIAMVTLIGLITKHGILITEFANQRRQLGLSIENAIKEAAELRLRPILMTTAAMILGALPLALAMGPGSETRHQVGWVIVGGLLIGTMFSLVVVPVAYTYLARLKKPRYDDVSTKVDIIAPIEPRV